MTRFYEIVRLRQSVGIRVGANIAFVEVNALNCFARVFNDVPRLLQVVRNSVITSRNTEIEAPVNRLWLSSDNPNILRVINII